MEFVNYGHLSLDDWRVSVSGYLPPEEISLDVEVVSSISLDSRNYTGWDDYLGIALMAGGMIWLVPGAGDVAAALIGVAIFKHLYGAVIGLAVYNAIAISAIGLGYYLTELD